MPAGTRILIFLTSTRDAMRDSSASQTDRSAQRSRAALPTTPPRSAKVSLPARKDNTLSPTSQSKNGGRSGQQVSCGAWSAKHSRSGTEVRLSGRAKYVTPADTRWRPCFARQRQQPHQRGGRHAKWRNSEWATANGKRGAAMQQRWRLPKGVLRPRFAIKKRRFPLRPCSGIDSAVARPWQHADVNEEKTANSVL